MSESSTGPGTDPAAGPATDPAAGSAAEPAADPAAGPAAEPADSEQPEEFVNRAARRAAKGKAGAKPQEQFRKGQVPTGRGAVQSPRQYGTRRSG